MLNVAGRNIADEGFSGSNVRDSNTGRFTSEGANSLAQSVRAGMSMTSTRDSSTANISAVVSKLTEAISNDTQNFQELLNKQDEKTKKLFDSYIKSLESGKTSNIEKAMEKFLLSMEKDTSKRFEKIIDAVGQRKALNEGNTVKQRFANFMGADADKGVGGSIAQAFSEPGRMFGKSGLLGTGLFSGGPTAAQQQATAELGKETQLKGIAELITNLYVNSKNESVSKIQAKNNKEKVAETGFSNKNTLEKVIIADQPIITKDAPKTVPGIDRNDPAAEQLQVLNKQLKVLEEILAELKKNPRGGLLSTAAVAGLGAALAAAATAAVAYAEEIAPAAKKAFRVLGPVGVAATAGLAVYEGVKGFNADKDATLGQKFQNAGRNIGSGLTFGVVDSVEKKMADGSYQADREAEVTQQAVQEAAAAQSLQEAFNRAGDNGAQSRRGKPPQSRRAAIVEGTATPAATMQKPNASPAATTPTVLPLIDGPATPGAFTDANGNIITEIGLGTNGIYNKTSGSVTRTPPVTSNAIQNMTNLPTSNAQSAPTIINNITNNNTSASSAAPQILTMPSTPRNNSNLIQRYQDMIFSGI